MPCYMLRVYEGPKCPPSRRGSGEDGWTGQLWGTKKGFDPRLHLSRGSKNNGIYTGTMLEIVRTSVCSQHNPSASMGPLCPFLQPHPALGQQSNAGTEKKQTFKRSRANSGLTLRVSAAANLGSDPAQTDGDSHRVEKSCLTLGSSFRPSYSVPSLILDSTS